MKRLITICAVVVLVAAFGSTAKAENPAEWTFSLVTHGEDEIWNSLTQVDTGYPQYDYDWSLTHVEGTDPWPANEIDGIWYDAWYDMPDEDKSGYGTALGLPFDILHIPEDPPEMFMDVYVYVDDEGRGHISVTDITFDQGITGFRFTGDVTVTAVPEPATLSLLGLGALSLIRRRKNS